MASLSQLGRALRDGGDDIAQIFHALVHTLTATLCDGCALELSAIDRPPIADHHDEAAAHLLAASTRGAAPCVHAFRDAPAAARALPEAYAPYIARVGLAGLVVVPLGTLGLLVGTRDGDAAPFTEDDVLAIATAADYASTAAARTLRFDAERASSGAARAQTAQFGQEMLGVVAHDLRSPLAAIVMGSERIVEGSTDGAATRTASQIGSFARRLTRMIDQLLDMTRLRVGGGLALGRSRVPLTPLVRGVVEELAPAHPTYRFELLAEADGVGHWDAVRVRQVLHAILRNAVQYGREDGLIRVRVGATATTAQVTVENELRGDPVPAAARPPLFEAYRRGAEDDLVGSGLGLDLYISREIVRQHGGAMSFASTPTGTTVGIDLPLRCDVDGATSPDDPRAISPERR